MTFTSEYADLTLDDLYLLHSQILAEHTAEAHRIMGTDESEFSWPLVPVFSREWQETSQRMASLYDQADDVYTEITRRESGLTRVPMVCTSCRTRVVEQLDGIGRWLHLDPAGQHACRAFRHGQPITAMVEAGNESVPRA
jgi:hypothetical protein